MCLFVCSLINIKILTHIMYTLDLVIDKGLKIGTLVLYY